MISMNYLAKEDLENVKGGGIAIGIAIALVAIGAFVIGFFDGYLRPYGCR